MSSEKWNKTILGLGKLNCPFLAHIANVESLREGELRFALLQWLFFTYNPEWINDRELQQEQEIIRLTKLAHSIGLCRENEVEALKGTRNAKRDMELIYTLVDLVLLKDELSESQLETQLAKDVQFMTSIVHGGVFKKNTGPVLSVTNLFRPGTSFKNTQTISQLEVQCKELEKSIEKLREELAQYKTEDTIASYDEAHQILHNDIHFDDYAEKLEKLALNVTSKREKERKQTGEISSVVRPMIQEYQQFTKVMQSYKSIHKQRLSAISFDQFQVPAWLADGSDGKRVK